MVFLGLGSNIGDREKNIKDAVRQLAAQSQITVKAVSSLYATAPVGYVDQPEFLNAVIGIETSLPPLALLAVCLEVELELGRKREVRWGPRSIDIDILLYDNVNYESDRLVLPHPRLCERRFALAPLAEIAARLVVCGGRTAGELLAMCADKNDVRFFKALNWEVE